MIRKAHINELEAIKELYKKARNYMNENGNPTQWGDNYPSEEVIISDIDKGELYVYEENNKVYGAFMLMFREESTYSEIFDGAWGCNEEYATVHRVASTGEVKGLFGKIVEYAKGKYDYIRIDTHENNETMKHLILKNGFIRCGIVYMEDKSARVAYEYKKV